MQHLEVSCAVRPIEWPLGCKWLMCMTNHISHQYTQKQNCNFVGLLQSRSIYILKGKTELLTRTLWPFGFWHPVAFSVMALCSLLGYGTL